MYIFSTEGGFGEAGITEQQRKENAMLQDSGFKDKNGKPLLINDLFRGVHDFFGHSERGNSFGAKGEENAWDVHARMFTDKARRIYIFFNTPVRLMAFLVNAISALSKSIIICFC